MEAILVVLYHEGSLLFVQFVDSIGDFSFSGCLFAFTIDGKFRVMGCFFVILIELPISSFVICVDVDLLMVARFSRIDNKLIRLLIRSNIFLHFFLKVISGVN